MSKAEKRHFKLYCGISGKDDNNYVRLFDYLDRQTAYNEDAVKKHFFKEAFVENYPVTKKYLNDKLMESLRVFYQNSKKDPLSKMRRHLQNLAVLGDKGLSAHFWREAGKARKLAEEHHLINEYVQLLEEEITFRGEEIMGDKFSKNEMLELQERIKTVSEETENKHQYSAILISCYFYFLKEHDNFKEWGLLLQEPLLKDENLAKSFNAKFNFLRANLFLSFLQVDLKKACDYAERMLKLVQENPAQIAIDIRNLIRTYQLCAMAYSFSRQFERAKSILKEYRNIPKKHHALMLGKERTRYLIDVWGDFIEIDLYSRKAEYAQIVERAPVFVSHFTKHKKYLTYFETALFYHYIAHAYFLEGHLNQALDWVNFIQVNNLIIDNPVAACHEDLLRLMIYYEMENSGLFKSEMRRLKKLIEGKPYYQEFWIPVLNLLSKISKKGNKNREKEILKESLPYFENWSYLQRFQVWMPSVNISEWIKRKLEGNN